MNCIITYNNDFMAGKTQILTIINAVMQKQQEHGYYYLNTQD